MVDVFGAVIGARGFCAPGESLFRVASVGTGTSSAPAGLKQICLGSSERSGGPVRMVGRTAMLPVTCRHSLRRWSFGVPAWLALSTRAAYNMAAHRTAFGVRWLLRWASQGFANDNR